MAKKFICHLLLMILCAGLVGCLPRRTVTPMGGGYEEVARTWTSISEPEATQISLQYRKPRDGRIMIWPSVRGYTIKNDMAVFVANKAYEQLDPDDPQATKSRLFAVKALELPLDITDEVIRRWAQKSGRDVAKALNNPSPIGPKEQNNKLSVYFEFNDWPGVDIRLSWDQVLDIMREVKEKEIVRKDRV